MLNASTIMWYEQQTYSTAAVVWYYYDHQLNKIFIHIIWSSLFLYNNTAYYANHKYNNKHEWMNIYIYLLLHYITIYIVLFIILLLLLLLYY